MGTKSAISENPRVNSRAAAPACTADPLQAACDAVEALFSRTQQRLLAILFGQPDCSFHISELIERTGSGRGAAQREHSAATRRVRRDFIPFVLDAAEFRRSWQGGSWFVAQALAQRPVWVIGDQRILDRPGG